MGKKVVQMPKSSAKVVQFEEKSSAPDLGKNKKKYVRKKIYYCELCAYETKNISNYKKHIKSKKHIKNENLKEKNENGKILKSSKKNGKKSSANHKIFECKFCSEISFSKTSYYRHNSICDENPFNKKKKKDELLEKNKELEKKVELLEKKTS